jgi:hypothetical protein
MAKSREIPVILEAEEHKQVRKDLVFVLLLNAVFFAGLFALFFFNRSTGQIDEIIASLMKF